MHVLAIDTSLPTGSVAALRRSAGGVDLVERPLGAAGEHARRLMPELVAAAASQGWQISDVNLVAVVRGPGSFTGLRVGVTTAKALCWATAARLVGVSGFEIVRGCRPDSQSAGRDQSRRARASMRRARSILRAVPEYSSSDLARSARASASA